MTERKRPGPKPDRNPETRFRGSSFDALWPMLVGLVVDDNLVGDREAKSCAQWATLGPWDPSGRTIGRYRNILRTISGPQRRGREAGRVHLQLVSAVGAVGSAAVLPGPGLVRALALVAPIILEPSESARELDVTASMAMAA